MKLLVITSLKEYLADISALLKQAGIDVFSVSKTVGIRTNAEANLLEDWFGSRPGEYDSVVVFSFTMEDRVRKAFELIGTYNKRQQTGFPVKAFMLPVEEAC